MRHEFLNDSTIPRAFVSISNNILPREVTHATTLSKPEGTLTKQRSTSESSRSHNGLELALIGQPDKKGPNLCG